MNTRAIAATAAFMLLAGCTLDANPDVESGNIDLADVPVGTTQAAFVEEHPVFVVHDDNGDVRVLDAVSPHRSDDFTKVLAWCETSGGFEDLWHGSRFDRNGDWFGGPAPTGMAEYATSRQGDILIVGELQDPPTRMGSDGDAVLPTGPECGQRTALYLPDHPSDDTVLADLTVHEPTVMTDDLWYPTEQRVLGNVRTRP